MGGYMLSKSGKPEAALRFYRRALSIDPSLGVAHVNLGKLLFEKCQFAEALAAFEAAATLTPGDADAWCCRAGALRELGRLEESLEAARRALALRPDFVEAAINLGNALMKLDRMDEALCAYRRASAAGLALPRLCAAKRWRCAISGASTKRWRRLSPRRRWEAAKRSRAKAVFC